VAGGERHRRHRHDPLEKHALSFTPASLEPDAFAALHAEIVALVAPGVRPKYVRMRLPRMLVTLVGVSLVAVLVIFMLKVALDGLGITARSRTRVLRSR
jgi:hypothetical protein